MFSQHVVRSPVWFPLMYEELDVVHPRLLVNVRDHIGWHRPCRLGTHHDAFVSSTAAVASESESKRLGHNGYGLGLKRQIRTANTDAQTRSADVSSNHDAASTCCSTTTTPVLQHHILEHS